MRVPIKHAIPLAALCLLVPSTSSAEDHVSFPYRGVTHIHRVARHVDAHIVLVDLSCPEIDVVATRPREGNAVVSTWAREQHAQIAINANFFDSSVCGLAMGDGRVWRDSYGPYCSSVMAFGPVGAGWRARVFDSHGITRESPVDWATQMVSGMPIMLRDGQTYFDPNEPTGMYRTHPRTAIGLSADCSTFIILVADGRRAGLPGLTSLEMIPLLEEFGAADAINLDGGGSSELWIESEGGIVNRPSDGHERVVMNHLGLRITSAD